MKGVSNILSGAIILLLIFGVALPLFLMMYQSQLRLMESGQKLSSYTFNYMNIYNARAYILNNNTLLVMNPTFTPLKIYRVWLVNKTNNKVSIVQLDPPITVSPGGSRLINITDLLRNYGYNDVTMNKYLIRLEPVYGAPLVPVNETKIIKLAGIIGNDYDWIMDLSSHIMYSNTSIYRVGIGTTNPQYTLDVKGDVRAISSTVHADYYRLTENGHDTPWTIDYYPIVPSDYQYGKIGIVYNGEPVFEITSTSKAYLYGTLKVQPQGTQLTSYPSGWAMGLWTWDVYAEGSIGVGTNGISEVLITHNDYGGEISVKDSGGIEKVRIDTIGGEGNVYTTNIYADYFKFTEKGTYTQFVLDYFPNSLDGENAIGIALDTNPLFLIDGNGNVKVNGRIGTNGYSPNKGYPAGWGGGIHTWDVYAEGSVGLGRNGDLVVWISGTGDGQGFVFLNNTGNGAWARISRWTDRLEIASSNDIEFKIGGYGNEGTPIMRMSTNSITINTDLNMNGHLISNVNIIYMENEGKIQAPSGTNLVFTDQGLQITDLSIGQSDWVLILDSNGYLRKMNITQYLLSLGLQPGGNGGTGSDNDWFWNGNYLYANQKAEGVGIGTTTPKYKLDVYGDIRAKGASVYADYFRFTEAGTPIGWYLDYFPDNKRIGFEINGTEVMSLLPNGYIGIGTTTPQYRLDVNGDIRAYSSRVYADYFSFTEGGDPIGWMFDYFPNAISRDNKQFNAIGLSINGQPMTLIDENGYVYAPRYYFTEEGQYTTPYFYLDYYPDLHGGSIGLAVVNEDKPLFQVDLHGYVYTPRLYITEEGKEAVPQWYIDYYPNDERIDFICLACGGQHVVQLFGDKMKVYGDVYGKTFKFIDNLAWYLAYDDVLNYIDIYANNKLVASFGEDRTYIFNELRVWDNLIIDRDLTLWGHLYLYGISTLNNPQWILTMDSSGNVYKTSVKDVISNEESIVAGISPKATSVTSVYETGYTISFSRSGPCTVLIEIHRIGRVDDLDPVTISVSYSNGKYYSFTTREVSVIPIVIPNGASADITLSADYTIKATIITINY